MIVHDVQTKRRTLFLITLEVKLGLMKSKESGERVREKYMLNV
jgi:hypothetical protein